MQDVMAEFYDGPHATPAPAEQGPVFLGIKNLTEDGHLDLGDIRHIAEADFPKWTKRVEPRPGDLVFTYEASLHRYAIIPPEFRGVLGRRVALIRPKASIVDTRFLLYLFLSPKWRSDVTQRINIGSTVDRIPLVEFPQFPVTIPPLQTQHKMATILSAYDDLIENNTRRIKILEEMAQRIYREWFVEFRYPGHEGVPLVDSELGPIPEGWRLTTLKEQASIVMGQSPKSEFYNNAGLGLPFHQGVTNFGSHFPTNSTYSTAGDRLAEKGDILFSVRAPVGRINVSTCKMILGRGLCSIRPQQGRAMFVLFQLMERFHELDTMGSGSIFNSVKRSDVEELPVLQPPNDLVDCFDGFAESIMGLIRSCTASNENLRATREFLLPRLISGDIDVENLDIDISGLAA